MALEARALSECPDPTVGNKYHPYMSSSRRKGNKSLRMTVVQRFLCKGAGYVSLKDEKSLSQLGLVSEQSTVASRTATEYVARLLIKAEDFVQKAMAKQHYRSLNFCFDAATFAGEQAGASEFAITSCFMPACLEVLSVVFRMDGCHFAGATQLLPSNTCSQEEAAAAATSLACALQGCLPESAMEHQNMPAGSWKFKEYRTSTKHLLCSLGNCLQQVMPRGWTLNGCRPNNPLLPAGTSSTRMLYDATELELLPSSLPEGSQVHFNWDFDSCKARPDFYTDEQFVRLVWAADEGTEACSCYFLASHVLLNLTSLKGFVAYQHLCSQDLWVVMWPDIFHKCARKAASSIRRLENGSSFLRKLMAVHRFSRGPFKSSRFGRLIADSRSHLIRLLGEDNNCEFVQLWLTGMAKDLAGLESGCESSMSCDFTGLDALRVLKEREGQA